MSDSARRRSSQQIGSEHIIVADHQPLKSGDSVDAAFDAIGRLVAQYGRPAFAAALVKSGFIESMPEADPRLEKELSSIIFSPNKSNNTHIQRCFQKAPYYFPDRKLKTLGDLLEFTEGELKNIRTLGKKLIVEVQDALWDQFGLTLKGSNAPTAAAGASDFSP